VGGFCKLRKEISKPKNNRTGEAKHTRDDKHGLAVEHAPGPPCDSGHRDQVRELTKEANLLRAGGHWAGRFFKQKDQQTNRFAPKSAFYK
jgi:hypothetical protein